MSIAMGHGPQFRNSSEKRADAMGQSLFVLDLTIKVRTISELSMKMGKIAQRSTKKRMVMPTTVLSLSPSRPEQYSCRAR